MNQMAMPGMNQMDMNQMAMPGMNQMAMNQMAMNQMAMPGMNMMGAQPKMDDIDAIMVNDLAPINNASANMNMNMNLNANTLMTPMQMANSMGSLGNLSKISNVRTYGDNMTSNLTEQNLTDQNLTAQFSNQMGMLNNKQNNTQLNSFNLKNLANLNSVKRF
jgi:hypothetical protein